MDFFEVVERRRSIRKFKPEVFPDESIEKALRAAILAPNSSNVQAWDFYWIKNPEVFKKAQEYCFNQSAARTATQLIAVVADPKLWRRSQGPLVKWVEEAKAPKPVLFYYQKLIPVSYRWGLFNILAPFKWLPLFLVGLFRPITRGAGTRGHLQEVVIKSAALAAENFVLAVTALGGASCMMEGFDEVRMKRLLKLGSSARIVMMIGVGYEGERGTWGPRFRLPYEKVVHKV